MPTPDSVPVIRDLHGLEEFQAVVELERAIWGYTDSGDLVTVPVFIIKNLLRTAGVTRERYFELLGQ